MKSRIPYSVPDGYFDTLEERLLRIPEYGYARERLHKTCYALAVVGAAVVSALLFISSPWSKGEETIDSIGYEQCLMSDLIPHTDPYLIYFSEETEVSTMTDQDIEDYLINCAVDINE